MVNITPLRLVAIGERIPAKDKDDQSAAPIRISPDHEAITRRVPNSATIAAHEVAAPRTRVTSRRRGLRPAGVPLALAVIAVLGVVLVVIGVGAALRGKGKGRSAVAPPSLGVAESPGRPAPASSPLAAAPVHVTAPPEVIHLLISAEPAVAELSLDGNVLAGHRLDLQVPKDRGIHVVSASAPGYIPVNQQVSFAGDITLNLSLRRDRAPVVRPSPRPCARVEAKPLKSAKTPTGRSGSAIEPGMDLDTPWERSGAKPIDERNPYKP